MRGPDDSVSELVMFAGEPLVVDRLDDERRRRFMGVFETQALKAVKGAVTEDGKPAADFAERLAGALDYGRLLKAALPEVMTDELLARSSLFDRQALVLWIVVLNGVEARTSTPHAVNVVADALEVVVVADTLRVLRASRGQVN